MLLSLFCLLTACTSGSNPEPDPQNNYLVDAQKVVTLSQATMKTAAESAGYGQYADGICTDVEAYKITYRTEYPAGSAVTASGVVVIPADLRSDFPTVLYAHGTIDQEATPSIRIYNPANYTSDLYMALVMAATFRCPVLVPDYIGYGSTSSILHPYIHKESSARGCYDMILAYKEHTVSETIAFNPSVFITGYSEGGYVAVALQERIQQMATDGLSVDMTIAGGGPYDNLAFAQDILSETSVLGVLHIGSYIWAIAMFRTDYNYSKTYAEIFSDEDNAILQAAGYNLGYFNPAMLSINRNPALLFKPEFISGAVTESDTELVSLLKANSLIDFAPRDSLILVCGSDDIYVYPENTRTAYNTMKAKGCPVRMYEMPGDDHYTAADYWVGVLLNRLSAR